ncbi:MAG: endolytic transglycosylase MltG [Parvibaculaceae bacterium]
MPDQRRQRRSVVVPPRRRRRSALRRVFYSLMLLAGCFVLAVFGLGLYGYVKFTEPGPLASDKTFQVERGGGVLGIAAELEKAGIVSSANIFAAAATATGERGRLKPGEYEFKQAMSMRDVMALIVSGKIITYKVTIPEGWTTAQALDRLRENEVLTGDISLTPAEGQIMPDTYVFQRGETRDHVVRGMMKASEKILDELWAQRAEDAPVGTPAEALILASIIEKETGVPEERARVAAVFANRLRQGMRLQSDPTIIYGITGGKSKLDRPLTRRDIAEATPYNTYRINGLPPGPIANPGRASIAAALAPARTNDLYFVADGSGGHVFAATLDEHRVNVRKWREIEKQRNQNGEEAPVMDEGGTATGAAAGPAEPAPAEPAPETAAQGQQGETSGLPSVAGLTTDEQEPGVDSSPEAQSEAEADQSGAASQAATAPIPRPKPEGVAPFVATAPTEPTPEPVPETTVADVALDLKPGSVIKGSKGLIPIPVPKPQAP